MLVSMTRENLSNFDGTVPAALLTAFAEDENYFGIGIVPDIKSRPVAAAVFTVDEENDADGGVHQICELKWTFVHENIREKGAATLLFSEILNLVEGTGVEAIKTYIPLDGDYEVFASMLERFGFTFDLTERFELNEQLGNIKEASVLRQPPESRDIYPLSAIRPRLFAQGLVAMADKTDMSDYALPLSVEAYDKDVSSVYMPESIPEGFLLVRVLEPELLDLVFLRCSGPKASRIAGDLLKCAVRACSKKYGNSVTIHALIRTEGAASLLADLLPNVRAEVLQRGYFII